jgi:DNA-binding transcriptional LysR family regulator
VNDRPDSPIGNELDLRALRYFVAAAEELQFTRAAARLFVAQQALSREIAALERRLGTPLFTRTTRRVALTPAGERLLGRARELLALQDLTWRELRPAARTVVVDLLSEGRQTAVTILDASRAAAPDMELRGTYGGGMARALGRILAGDIDVAFGRADWIGRPPARGIESHVIRYEPLALLLPDDHPLAESATVPLAAIADLEIDANIDDPNSADWSDLARQMLALAGARAAPQHPVAIGLAETANHLRHQGLPILTGLDQVEVAGVSSDRWSIPRRSIPGRSSSGTARPPSPGSRRSLPPPGRSASRRGGYDYRGMRGCRSRKRPSCRARRPTDADRRSPRGTGDRRTIPRPHLGGRDGSLPVGGSAWGRCPAGHDPGRTRCGIDDDDGSRVRASVTRHLDDARPVG